MFRAFSRLLEVLAALVAAIGYLAKIQKEAGPAIERLDALELSRHQFEAEIQGILLKAEGKLAAASNAEARERQLKKSYERLVEESDLDGDPRPEEDGVLPLDAQEREAERLHALRLDVAPNNKTLAVRAKFGL